MKLKLEILRIPFKVVFKHASAERKVTSTVWVEAIDGAVVGYGESCPRPYVTGESEESCQIFFEQFQYEFEKVNSVAELIAWKSNHRGHIQNNLAAWCAIELAMLDLFSRRENQTQEELLGVKSIRGIYQYTAVLGDASWESWKVLFDWHYKKGMTDYKLKMSGHVEEDRRKIQFIKSQFVGNDRLRIRLDLNNLFKSEGDFLTYWGALDEEVFGVEEPLEFPNYEALNRISKQLSAYIILDEHLCMSDQLNLVSNYQKMIFNVRVSKCGGIINAIEMAQESLQRGMKIIVGAQVGETSVLTRASLILVQALQGNVVAQEGAYGSNLLETDPLDHFIEFGHLGLLEVKD